MIKNLPWVLCIDCTSDTRLKQISLLPPPTCRAPWWSRLDFLWWLPSASQCVGGQTDAWSLQGKTRQSSEGQTTDRRSFFSYRLHLRSRSEANWWQRVSGSMTKRIHTHTHTLTGFLEKLFPDAVRCRVLTRLHCHRQSRVLLRRNTPNSEQNNIISTAEGALPHTWNIKIVFYNIPGWCRLPGGHLQTDPRLCSGPIQYDLAGFHSPALDTQ